MSNEQETIFSILNENRRSGKPRERIFASIKLIDHLMEHSPKALERAEVLRKFQQRMIEQLKLGNESASTLAFLGASTILDDFINFSLEN